MMEGQKVTNDIGLPSCFAGCGSGKYLDVNPGVFNIGSDRCRALAQIAREKDHEVSAVDEYDYGPCVVR